MDAASGMPAAKANTRSIHETSTLHRMTTCTAGLVLDTNGWYRMGTTRP